MFFKKIKKASFLFLLSFFILTNSIYAYSEEIYAGGENIGIEIIKSQIDGLHEKKKIIDDNHGSYDKKEERLIIQSTIPLVIRQKELNTYKDMDKEIQQIHWREIFYITMARIATYWSGVLQASKKIDDFKDIPATCVNKEDLYRQYFKDDNSRGDNNHDDEKK